MESIFRSIRSQIADMRVLNAVTFALLASHATARCPYSERAAAPAAGCPYAKQAAKRDVMHAPARRQAIADKKGIFYSEFDIPVDGKLKIDHVLRLYSEPNWTFRIHSLHCQRRWQRRQRIDAKPD